MQLKQKRGKAGFFALGINFFSDKAGDAKLKSSQGGLSVAYQIRTPDFWNSLDMIGGKSSYTMGGSFFDGKGQPPQVNAVSHGSPPARFRNVNVINTGRKG